MDIRAKMKRSGRIRYRVTVLFLAAALGFGALGAASAASVKPSPASDAKPVITVEGNVVVDNTGKPTGFFELSVKIKTPAKGSDLASMLQTMGVMLKYDTTILTPASWDEEGETTTLEPNKWTPLETAKPGKMVTAGARAYDFGGGTALLQLWAEADMSGLKYENDTAICVVRFTYKEDTLPANLTTLVGSGTDNNEGANLVWLATDGEAATLGMFVGQSLWYNGITDDGALPMFYYTTMNPPESSAGFVVNTGTSGSPNYTTNLLTVGTDLIFTSVQTKGYFDGGVNLDDVITIVFYDWDDVLLGSLVVERGDARQAVSEYIEQNFIHPDLWASDKPGASYTDSLERQYTYRGEYPANVTSGVVDENGSNYPLTNKLDYVFYKRATTHQSTYNPDTDNAWSVTPVGGGGEGKFPYAYGWAMVKDAENIADVWTTIGVGELNGITMPKSGTTSVATGTFTTLADNDAGYFQFADFSNLNIDDYPESNIIVKAVYEPGASLDLINAYTAVPGSFAYERYGTFSSVASGNAYSIRFQYQRAYEGRGVLRTRDPAFRAQYTPDVGGAAGTPFYVRVPVTNSEIMDVEIVASSGVISVSYALMEMHGANFVVGGLRTRISDDEQIHKLYGNFDYSHYSVINDNHLGSKGFVFYATLNQLLDMAATSLENGITDVSLTALTAYMDYETMRDLNLRLADGVQVTSTAYVAINNIRTQFYDACRVAYEAGQDVRALTWHQIQYHIIGKLAGGNGIDKGSGNIMSEAECINAAGYDWCRLRDDCYDGPAYTPPALNSVASLLQAAYEYSVVGEAGAWNNLTGSTMSNLFLAKGDPNTGDDFASLTQFTASDLTLIKNTLHTLVQSAGATYSTLTWYQVQDYLIKGAPILIDAEIDREIYFWGPDGTGTRPIPPPPFTLQDLLVATYQYPRGNTELLTAITAENLNEIDLRKNAAGDPFTDDDLSAMRARMTNMENRIILDDLSSVFISGGTFTMTQREVQYYLITGTLKREASIGPFDWEPYTPQAIGSLSSLLQAAYEAKVWGRADAWNNLTPAKIDVLFLAMSDPGSGEYPDLNKWGAGNLATFKTRMENLITAAGTGYASLTWYQIQDYLFTGGPLQSDATVSRTLYFWGPDGTGTRPVGPTITFEELVWAMFAIAMDGDNSYLAAITVNDINSLDLKKTSSGDPFVAGDMSFVEQRAFELLDAVWMDDGYFIDWDGWTYFLTMKELQHFFATGELDYDANIDDSLYPWLPVAFTLPLEEEVSLLDETDEEAPPVEEEETPPADEEETPPVDEEETPPADEEETPPVDEETPPVDEEETPPAEEDESPPPGETEESPPPQPLGEVIAPPVEEATLDVPPERQRLTT